MSVSQDKRKVAALKTMWTYFSERQDAFSDAKASAPVDMQSNPSFTTMRQ